MAEEITGWVDVRVVLPINLDRISVLQAGLREWFDDNSMTGVKLKRAKDELHITFSYRARELPNGTLSAAAAIATKIDEALDEVSEYRWFHDIKVTARFAHSRDEQDEEEEEDGDDET